MEISFEIYIILQNKSLIFNFMNFEGAFDIQITVFYLDFR